MHHAQYGAEGILQRSSGQMYGEVDVWNEIGGLKKSRLWKTVSAWNNRFSTSAQSLLLALSCNLRSDEKMTKQYANDL
jgi:hypothetical protein